MAKVKHKQQDFFKKDRSDYGGKLYNTREGRSHGRPLSTKSSMHLVLRSSQAVGPMSFRRHDGKIKKILKKFADKYGVKILSLANVGNHLHLQIKLSNRYTYKKFIRAVTSAIRTAVTGINKWTANGGKNRKAVGSGFKTNREANAHSAANANGAVNATSGISDEGKITGESENTSKGTNAAGADHRIGKSKSAGRAGTRTGADTSTGTRASTSANTGASSNTDTDMSADTAKPPRIAHTLTGKFWDLRPFTRILTSFREYRYLQNYLAINRLEAHGYTKQQARFLFFWDLYKSESS